MRSNDKTQEVILQAKHVRRETEDVLLAALRTALKAVSTMCVLAEREAGEEQARHLQQAETGLGAVARMAKGVRLTQQDRDAMAQVRRAVLSLQEKAEPLPRH